MELDLFACSTNFTKETIFGGVVCIYFDKGVQEWDTYVPERL